MRRLILKMSVSVDGFVAGPSGETGWLARGRDGGSKAWVAETLWRAGLHAMGRCTYADMAAHWPGSTDLLAAPMNDIPKIVFTRQPTLNVGAGPAPRRATSANATDWGQPQIANGDLATEIGRLKAQDGKDILAHGGASFAQSLARLDLIDEYRLLVHPVALGAGLPLFTALPKPLDLKLVSVTAFASGAVAQIYMRA